MSYPPRGLLFAWLGLLTLLASTVALAYQPLGYANTPIALAIATVKALLVAVIFMELREGRGVIIGFAAAGFLWLWVLFWLSGTDFMTRSYFPLSPLQ